MCSSHGYCSDNDGSYECQCLDGFEGDGYECSNIDECQLGLDRKISFIIYKIIVIQKPFSHHFKKFMTAQNSHFAQTT